MNFCNIISFFDTNSIRSISNLSRVYSDSRTLTETIRSFVSEMDESVYNKKVLLKPNWVTHNRKVEDDICLRTHESVIICLLRILIEKNPSRILIGDAPIQGCNWERIFNDKFIKEVEEIRSNCNIPIEIKDFRRRTFNPKSNNPVSDINPLSDYLIFDLKDKSFLDPISTESNSFRVTNYDPERMGKCHKKGIHQYCITKEVFDSDLIISIPKVKTHQKTGLTAALKNIVGINGDKDYLPHHRIGGTGFGGDCYPGKNILRFLSEKALDSANRNQGKWIYKPLTFSAAAIWKMSLPQKVHHLAAGWYGNDTTWRMVMDLNKIMIYGKSDGTLADIPQREIFSLCDGIIAGEGDGPLNPLPLPLGILSFTNNSGLNDICMATLMGFDYKKIPLLRNQIIDFKNAKIIFNGQKIEFEDLIKYKIMTKPSPGWESYLK